MNRAKKVKNVSLKDRGTIKSIVSTGFIVLTIVIILSSLGVFINIRSINSNISGLQESVNVNLKLVNDTVVYSRDFQNALLRYQYGTLGGQSLISYTENLGKFLSQMAEMAAELPSLEQSSTYIQRALEAHTSISNRVDSIGQYYDSSKDFVAVNSIRGSLETMVPLINAFQSDYSKHVTDKMNSITGDSRKSEIYTLVAAVMAVVISILYARYVSKRLLRFSTDIKISVYEASVGSERLIESAMEVDSASSKTSLELSEVDSEVINIRDNIGTISQGVSSLSESLNKVIEINLGIAQASEEILSSVDECDRTVVKIRRDVSEKSEEVTSTVSDVYESIKESQTISGEMMKLQDKIKAVEGILMTIGEISNSINLLSLNAAIEAARAGEHGLGFAVVAEEVRKLADRTRESIGSVEGIITDITDHTKQTVKEFVRVNGESLATIDKVKGVSAVFNEIVEAFTEVEESVTLVIGKAKDTVERTRNTQQELEEVMAVSEEMAAKSIEISTSTDDFSDMVRRVIANNNINLELAKRQLSLVKAQQSEMQGIETKLLKL